MTTKTKRIFGTAAAAALWMACFAISAVNGATADGPDLPEGCSQIAAPEGTRVAFKVYAIGDQIYRWNGTAWVLRAPDAKLYVNENYQGLVGTHFGGPTWQSVSGSSIVAAKVNECIPDTNAIAWLLLQKVVTEGPGIFSRVEFIQRVSTTGGLKPTYAGTNVGDEVNVPYTAEYYFYRSKGALEN